MGPPAEIAPETNPLYWTDRQITRMLEELPEEQRKWQEQMRNKGVHYESLHEMQQKEIERKREKSEWLRLHPSLSGPRPSTPNVSWLGTRGQPVIPLEKLEFVPGPNSMLAMYEEQSRLKKDRITHAKTTAMVVPEGVGGVYSMSSQHSDEIRRRQHEEMVGMRMPAMHREARSGLASQRRAMSLYENATTPQVGQRRASVMGSRPDARSASIAHIYGSGIQKFGGSMSADDNTSLLHLNYRRGVSSSVGARSSLGIGMHASKSQEILGLGINPCVMEGVPHPLRRVVSMDPGITGHQQLGRMSTGRPIHRSGIGRNVQFHPQIGSEQAHDYVLSPPHRVRKGPASLYSLQADRTRGLRNRTHLPSEQLQYAHLDNHNDYVGVNHVSETPLQHLKRPSTAPLERRGVSLIQRIAPQENETEQQTFSSTNLPSNRIMRYL
jgi:hypothetical protein